jgi:hypothetical protein
MMAAGVIVSRHNHTHNRLPRSPRVKLLLSRRHARRQSIHLPLAERRCRAQLACLRADPALRPRF